MFWFQVSLLDRPFPVGTVDPLNFLKKSKTNKRIIFLTEGMVITRGGSYIFLREWVVLGSADTDTDPTGGGSGGDLFPSDIIKC